jgi:hypothetical protein
MAENMIGKVAFPAFLAAAVAHSRMSIFALP